MNKLRWSMIFIAVLIMTALLIMWSNTEKGASENEFLFDTYCTVTAYGNDAGEAVSAVFQRLRQIHDETNAFSESSEVFRINSAKAGEAISLSADMVDILTTADRVGTASDGAFDVCIAPVVSLWDFKGEGRIPSSDELETALEASGARNIVFDAHNKTVTKLIDSAKIDLGGAAKGYAGDVAISVLKQFDVSGAIVDLGGNISCMGTNPESNDGLWRIGLQTPFAPTGEYDEERIVEISEGAVVTSGTYQRYFEKDGKKYHHIIDPKTGFPAEREYSSVTIVTESSLLGDCLSTACFVLGKDKGTALAESFGAECSFE